MGFEYKPKEKEQVDLICGTCGKPISDKAKSDVTRFLTFESRCMCGNPALVVSAEEKEKPDSSEASAVDASVVENLGENYEVLGLLGRGGMGAVYKVRDRRLNRTFAVKVLNPNLVEDKSSVKRFEQEAKAASSLTQVNLCQVFDYGMGKKGAPYLVMEYLDGKSLSEIIAEEGYIDVPRALDLFVQTAEALSYAHTQGVVHRDITPNNIIVEKKEANVELVKIVDFGIAKVLPKEIKATTNLTQTSEIIGSPLYMSPEQCQGNKLDARTDIYALGCVMYIALTGKAPFEAENPIKTILKHVTEEPVRISDLPQNYHVPTDLERIIFHCLEKNPEARYQTAQDLMRDLQDVREGKPLKFKIDPLKQPQRVSDSGVKRRFVAKLAIGVILLGVACGVIFGQQQHRQDPSGLILSGEPYTDAEKLDQLSYQYFSTGQYEKAIPYLEFGLQVYKEGGHHFKNPNQESFWLADQIQHIGKCNLMLDRFDKAAPYYQKALAIYNKIGKWDAMDEAVADYATVLDKLGRSADAKNLRDEYGKLPRLGKLSKIP